MSGLNAGLNGAGTAVVGSTGAFSGDATVGGTLAVTGVITATAGVVGNVTGTADYAELGDDPEIAMPSYRTLVRRGFTPSALLRMQEASGNLVSSGDTADSGLTASGTPTYRRMLNGLRGAYIDTGGDLFTADVYSMANASGVWAFIFSAASSAADRYIGGRYDTVTAIGLTARILTADTPRVHIQDVGTNQVDLTHAAISFGSSNIYMLGIQVDRVATTMRSRLSKLGTGLVGTQQSGSIAAIGTLAGGSAPLLNLGGVSGVEFGAGVWHGGFAFFAGAQTEGAAVLANLAAAAGFE